VLRDGKMQNSARMADVDVPWIIDKMVGKTMMPPQRSEKLADHRRRRGIAHRERLSAESPAAAISSITSRCRSLPARSSASTA
jgi:ABC-type sugar transport system ATPase subunit